MKKLSLIIAAVLLSSICCCGQQSSDSSAFRAAKLDSSIATLHLDTLHGKIPALYSKDYKVRAETIQSMVEKCAEFYEPKFPDIKFDLQIFVIDSSAWHKIPLHAHYGMPNANPRISKLFIAADKQAVSKSDNTPDNTLSTADCIALHELGHIFLIGFNHTNTQKKWANEFLASYFAIGFFQQHKNYPGLPQVDETDYQPKYKALADFERLYSKVGAPNYGWYQGKFQELGKRLYPKFKVELIRKFIANYSANGKKLPPLALLKQLAPEITNQWLKEMK